ncbi:unnamed protein product [Sphenostylis stenocarpa]|uniref:RING-type E3 ubiquitin transferase n=1 Tax=Sphenostylis stenocarpa TaxID=92480 RepID=A0AA86V488_9FABA|nr:unnamed protein product [Sphenostylis stenocarpa]
MQWSNVDDICIIDFMDLGHRSNNNNYTYSGVRRSTEDVGVSIFDFMNTGHDNMENDRVLRSIEEGVYIIDFVNSGHNNNNVQNNGSRISRSTEDGVFIFDSMNLNEIHYTENNVGVLSMNLANHDSVRNLESFTVEEKTEDSCSICLMELSFGSRAIRMPHPCSHIFHQHCITRWLNISHTCPLCRRTI